ncbi:MAG: hypothetical protein GY839_07190 [candidate division Zixibacteria bacterium]|nr:hypothetical protein [candidate division Zixibacteria bacterium]
MVSINYAFKEMISKVVYYGPGLSGKTTNLQYVFKKVPQNTRGELISLATDADRTLYFDFLPVNVGNIKGFSVKFQLYTVPGQVYYNATRKLVLRGVDGLVFVADSQNDKMDENIESLNNLQENLIEYGYNLNEMPFVIQYNKRDLPNIATIDQLEQLLNPSAVPYYEAVATTGEGVFGTLKAISKLVIDKAQKSSAQKPATSKTAVVSASDEPDIEPVPQPVDVAPVPEVQTPITVAQPVPESKAPEEYREPTYGELSEDQLDTSSTSEIGVDTAAKPMSSEAPAERPAIVRESETMTNVVVSSGPEETEKEQETKPAEDIEETTEHSVLLDDTNETNETNEIETEVSNSVSHPDILDADRLDNYTSEPVVEVEEDTGTVFDEEATVVTDPKQTVASFNKPQMAESVKVKGKKKSGLFGWLKRKRK